MKTENELINVKVGDILKCKRKAYMGFGFFEIGKMYMIINKRENNVTIQQRPGFDFDFNLLKGIKIALILNGYIKEDLIEVPAKFIQYFYSEKMAKRHAIALCSFNNRNLNDYHTIKVQKTISGWKEIEGSEKHLN